MTDDETTERAALLHRTAMGVTDEAIYAAQRDDSDTFAELTELLDDDELFPELLHLWVSMIGRWCVDVEAGGIHLESVVVGADDDTDATAHERGRVTRNLVGSVLATLSVDDPETELRGWAATLAEHPFAVRMSVSATLVWSIAARISAAVRPIVSLTVTRQVDNTTAANAGWDSSTVDRLVRAVVATLSDDDAHRELAADDAADLLTTSQQRETTVAVLLDTLVSRTVPGVQLISGHDPDALAQALDAGSGADEVDLSAIDDPAQRGALLSARMLRDAANGYPDRAWEHYRCCDGQDDETAVFTHLAHWVAYHAQAAFSGDSSCDCGQCADDDEQGCGCVDCDDTSNTGV